MTKEIDKLLATMPLRRRLEAARYDAELRQRPVEAWELVEATKRLLKGVELSQQEADALHELVRQNTRRGRK